MPLGRVVRAMFVTRAHVAPTVLLVWGVVTGVLGVAVTIEKQVRAASGGNTTALAAAAS